MICDAFHSIQLLLGIPTHIQSIHAIVHRGYKKPFNIKYTRSICTFCITVACSVYITHCIQYTLFACVTCYIQFIFE